MKKRILIAFCVLAVLVLASCTSAKMSNLAYGIQGEELGDFTVTVKSFELIGGAAGPHLVGMEEWKGQALVETAIKEQMEKFGGTGVINLKIQRTATFIDILLNSVTENIYAPETIVISGTVIK